MGAFQGFRLTVERIVSEGGQVGAYVVVEGTHTGEFRGMPPTGTRIRFSMFNLFTVKDGKIIEKRAHYNTLDVIEQLEAGAGVRTHTA